LKFSYLNTKQAIKVDKQVEFTWDERLLLYH